MNTKDILDVLTTSFMDFYLHPRFLMEIKQLLKKELSGQEACFFRILQTQLANINMFGSAIDRIDKNEKLTGNRRTYYSIHLQSKQFNIRFLLYFKNDTTPLFLCAFYERQGKRKTSYSHYLPVLDDRLNDMLGDDADE